MRAWNKLIKRSVASFVIFSHFITCAWAQNPTPAKLPPKNKEFIISNDIKASFVPRTDSAQSMGGLSAMAVPSAATAVAAVPIPTYSFDIVADTSSPILGSGTTPVGLGLPSINDAGKIAFTAQYESNGRPYIVLADYDSRRVLKNYLPGEPARTSAFVQVNNKDQIAFQERTDDLLISYVKRLDEKDSGVVIASGSLAPAFPGNFDIVLPYPTINNDGLVVLGANDEGGTLLAARADGTGPHDQSLILPGQFSMFPMVSDYAETVAQFGDTAASPLVYAYPTLANRKIIASTDGGAEHNRFSVLGNKPGISDDGYAIGFMARHQTQGDGIFIYLYDGDAGIYRGPLKITGIPSSSNLNYRVSVNRISATKQFTVVFLAKDAAGVLGLYSNTLDATNPQVIEGTGPILLAQVGKPIPPFSATVADINIYDAVNSQGQVAFWIRTTAGGQAIVRAKTGAPAAGDMTQAPINNPETGADPVYLHSGQFQYAFSDLIIPGRGMDLSVGHRYLGQTALVSPFGFGWSLNYNERINILPDGAAEISDGTGRKDVYSLNGTQFVPPKGFYQTLVKNTDATLTLTESDGSKKIFDAEGKLTRIEDRNGNTIVLSYDSRGKLPIMGPGTGTIRVQIGTDYRLTKLTGTNGRVVELSYNADGLLSSMRDVAGNRTVNFAYDKSNNLLKITRPATVQFPSGVAQSFTYDVRHNVLSVRDGKNQTYITNTYNTENRVTRQNYGGGNFTFVYEGKKTTVTDRKGYVSVHEFNDAGNPVRVTQVTKSLRPTDPSSFLTINTYDENMELISTQYPKGNGAFYKYDTANVDHRARGNLLEVRKKANASAANNDSEDIVSKYTYEPQFQQVKTTTDALGRVTTFTYDYELPASDPHYGLQGNLVKIEQPSVASGAPTTWFIYNAFGQPTEIIDALGNVTGLTYDPATGYLESVVQDPSGINASTQLAYDGFGNMSSVTDPNGKSMTFQYNQLGWLLSATDALGRQVKYTHDANGNVLKEERQSNSEATTWQTTTFTYGILDHLKSITDPLLRTTNFSYDANENLISHVDPKGNTTRYEFDERDLLFKTTKANSGTTQYDYDANGLLATLSDENANKTSYTYDGFNRLTRMAYAKTSDVEQYSYDKNGNLTQRVTPENQPIAYAYDALNRLTSQTYSDPTMNVIRDYDLGSRLTRIANSFSDVTYAYDRLGRVTTEIQKLGTLVFSIASEYDKAGNRTKVTYPSGKAVAYAYNALNQVTDVLVNAAALAHYAYDPLNRLTQKDLLGTTTQSALYGYDAANQLLTLENKLNPVGTGISKHTYTYDAAGNRTTHANLAAGATKTINFTYDRIHELTATTGAQAHSYTYDKAGNRTKADNVAYVSNNLNQYTTVGGIALDYDRNGNLTKDNGGATYIYDAENRMLQSTKGPTVGKYHYDGLNRRISKEVDAATTLYIHDGAMTIEERNIAGDLVADYVNGNRIDEVLTMTRGGNTYHYFYDALGSVRQLTDAAGTVVESYDYDVFGKPLTTSTVGNTIMFTGRWYDAESGNYFYRARYYSPTLGRFLQRDPIGYYDSMNLYQYVGNNPANWIDPSGLQMVLDFEILTITIIFVVGYLCGQAILQNKRITVEIPFWSAKKDNTSESDKKRNKENVDAESTPDTNPSEFENVKRSKAKRNRETGEIWTPDLLHRDHYEVYKNRRDYERGNRNRSVWKDGKLKERL